MSIFAKACPISSIFVTCSFNPHIGYIDDEDETFLVPAHTYHNFGLPMMMLVLYLVVCTIIAVKMHRNTMVLRGESAAIPRVSRISVGG
ncbi:hypothetical protein AAVH_14150 [Aphelenchoides avenae]|nr:hypothetical protein AAVH_14150 [Aphelenchus avenae]